jgi:hypothetical protein
MPRLWHFDCYLFCVSRLTRMPKRICATDWMPRRWLTPLPTAILALFLLGFPCRSMMLYMQAPSGPAHDCCDDHCDEAPLAPSQGCQTLCVASDAQIILNSADDSTIGVPAGFGPVDPITPDPLILPGVTAAALAPAMLGSPPLYLQHSSLLI